MKKKRGAYQQRLSAVEVKRRKFELKEGAKGIVYTVSQPSRLKAVGFELMDALARACPDEADPVAHDSVDAGLEAELAELREKPKRFAVAGEISRGIGLLRVNAEGDTPSALVHALFEAASRKEVGIRGICRILPMDDSSTPKAKGIRELLSRIVAKQFKDTPVRYAMSFNARCSGMKKEEVMAMLNELVEAQGAHHELCVTLPDRVMVVECNQIFAGAALVKDFDRWDEFNFGAQDFGDDGPDSAGE